MLNYSSSYQIPAPAATVNVALNVADVRRIQCSRDFLFHRSA